MEKTTNPLLLFDFAFAVCQLMGRKSLHSLCLSCSSLFNPAAHFLWRSIRIRSVDSFLKFQRTLSTPQSNSINYASFIEHFVCDFPEYLNSVSPSVFSNSINPSVPFLIIKEMKKHAVTVRVELPSFRNMRYVASLPSLPRSAHVKLPYFFLCPTIDYRARKT